MTDQKAMHLINKACGDYEGEISVLRNLLGFICLGHMYGWRVLILTQSRRTVRNYELALGKKIKEIFPEETMYSMESDGYVHWAVEGGNFWKIANGEHPIENKRNIRSYPF